MAIQDLTESIYMIVILGQQLLPQKWIIMKWICYFKKKQKELHADLPNRPWVVEAVMRDLGYEFVDTINPKTSMGSMKIRSFLKNNSGKYILKSREHICYAENGKVIDIWDSSKKLLMGYWIVV